MAFAAKPRQAMAMLARAFAAGVPFAWFTADEVYGQATYLRAWLHERDVSYVLAIRRSDTFTTSAGQQRADALTAAVPARSWQRLSAGAGAHGPANTTGRASLSRPGPSPGTRTGCWPAAAWPTRPRSEVPRVGRRLPSQRSSVA